MFESLKVERSLILDAPIFLNMSSVSQCRDVALEGPHPMGLSHVNNTE